MRPAASFAFRERPECFGRPGGLGRPKFIPTDQGVSVFGVAPAFALAAAAPEAMKPGVDFARPFVRRGGAVKDWPAPVAPVGLRDLFWSILC